MKELSRRDFIYGGIGALGLMFISHLQYEVQQLEQQIENDNTSNTYRDMEILRLTNEAREQIGLTPINTGIGGYVCEEAK